ncbi:inositol monophosphatase family protein [Kitasatospora azatica]|uniref:inositol monophosphatase family protein n=1 Tax=Kitasatospora azatica TaxID=58347 RepID=UPI00068E5C53|nr:inositol monophosphatase family protein [Kitasatospora azatica]
MTNSILTETTAAVREVGAWLVERHRAEPVAARTRDEALAAFAAIDGPAAALLRERLTALRPQAGWVAEELDSAVPVDGEWWLCDATDGAVQYLLGQPHWAVTATLLRDGEAVLAVVHAPLLGFTYTAARGEGAWLNERLVSPSTRELAAAVVATSQPPTVGRDPAALRRAGSSLTAVLSGGVLAVRNLGPTALQVAQVGSGHLDAFWEFGLDGPNLLPGALIASEAGALVTDHSGAPWLPHASAGFLAAPRGQHAELVRLLG